jgi:hypothetical protein
MKKVFYEKSFKFIGFFSILANSLNKILHKIIP